MGDVRDSREVLDQDEQAAHERRSHAAYGVCSLDRLSESTGMSTDQGIMEGIENAD
jgi:hypothetical protein